MYHIHKLLQKIEELTLYAIEQEKKINTQNKKEKSLENRLQVLEKIILNTKK
ncbi:hypothetical protein GCM10011397_15200 [Wenyingzhuangia marina]|nr:hypothetical protein GCM10011397_15200 [Wenyingzhuangia marina]